MSEEEDTKPAGLVFFTALLLTSHASPLTDLAVDHYLNSFKIGALFLGNDFRS